MASLVKNFRLLLNISSAIKTKTSQRTIFAPSALGIDGFKKQQEKSELLAVNNIEQFKKRFEETLKENKPLFTEDLKTLLYLSRNDADLNLLIQGLKKYKTQSLAISDFRFGAPFMRLLYILNKADDALKLYEDPELLHIFENETTSLILLMNKLSEEKRYQDVVKLFYSTIQNKKRFKDPVTQKNAVPSDIIRLVVEALYHLNDKSALDDLNKIFQILKEGGNRIPLSSIVNSVLLALNQNEIDLSYKLLSFFENIERGGFALNMKAIVLAKKKNFTESFAEINTICESNSSLGLPLLTYPLTMKLIREEVEKSEDKQSKEAFETISKKVISLNRLSSRDITELTLGVIENRSGPKRAFGDRNNRPNQYFGDNRRQFQDRDSNFRQSRNDEGFRRNFERGPGFNRDSNFERGPRFNRGSNFESGSNFDRQQGTQNVGGYSRPPRTFQQNNRFDQGQQQIGNRTSFRSTKSQDDE